MKIIYLYIFPGKFTFENENFSCWEEHKMLNNLFKLDRAFISYTQLFYYYKALI